MSESMFKRVSHENTQIQKHTNTQIHKYTNTLWTESEDRHDMCYIFEKLMLQGCQNQCLEGFLMKIHENTMRLAGTRSEHPEKALFLNKKGRRKGEKSDFQKFSAPYVVGFLSRGIDGISSKQLTDLKFIKPFRR